MITSNGTHKRSNVVSVVLCGTLFACVSHAALTTCGTGNAANLGSGTGGVHSAGAGSNIPANGCGQVDLGFNNYSVTTTGGDVAGPADGTIAPSAAGTASGYSVTPIDLVFTSAGWNITSRNGAHTMDSGINYTVTPNSAGGAEPPTGTWDLDGLSALAVTGAAVTGTAPSSGVSIQIIETICLGATTAAGCSTTGGTADEATTQITETWNGSSFVTSFGASCATVAASFGCTANNGAGTIAFNTISTAYIEDAITINHPANGSNSYGVSFSSFVDPFLQDPSVPEPSSLILMGTAVAGLALLKLRRANGLFSRERALVFLDGPN